MVDHYVNTITYNFVNNSYPYYQNEIFVFAPHFRIGTRNNSSKLKNPFHKTNMGQKQFLKLVPLFRTACLTQLKKTDSLNTFKHNATKHYLSWIIHNVYMKICVSLYRFICPWVCVCIYIWIYINVFLWFIHFHVFFSHSPFSLIFVLTWGNTMEIRRFCPFCAISVIADAIHICLQWYFIFNFHILTSLFVCFLFCLD